MDQRLHLICRELNTLIPPRLVRNHGPVTDLIERDRPIDEVANTDQPSLAGRWTL